MKIAKAEPRGELPLVGHFNRRTGQVLCAEHRAFVTDSPTSPWVQVRAGDRWEARDGSTAPIRCHDCGRWLEYKYAGFSGPHPSLVVACPVCLSPVAHYCNGDDGRPTDRPHDERRALAGTGP